MTKVFKLFHWELIPDTYAAESKLLISVITSDNDVIVSVVPPPIAPMISPDSDAKQTVK